MRCARHLIRTQEGPQCEHIKSVGVGLNTHVCSKVFILTFRCLPEESLPSLQETSCQASLVLRMQLKPDTKIKGSKMSGWNFTQNGHPRKSYTLARQCLETTTDLSPISGLKVLVLLDEQNLSITADGLGFSLDYAILARRIRSMAHKAELHLFTAANARDAGKGATFDALGYFVHIKRIRYVRLSADSVRRDSNVDNLFSFWAGILAPSCDTDVFLLASGDYGLAGELAQAICDHRAPQQVRVMTLSLPGSTSRDLDARKNPHVTANLEIGLDLLNGSF